MNILPVVSISDIPSKVTNDLFNVISWIWCEDAEVKSSAQHLSSSDREFGCWFTQIVKSEILCWVERMLQWYLFQVKSQFSALYFGLFATVGKKSLLMGIIFLVLKEILFLLSSKILKENSYQLII